MTGKNFVRVKSYQGSQGPQGVVNLLFFAIVEAFVCFLECLSFSSKHLPFMHIVKKKGYMSLTLDWLF